MIKKTLGVNTSHHCSFAYFENDILKEYYEEDRFNKIKYFDPETAFSDYKFFVLKKFKDVNFDCVYFSTYDRNNDEWEKNVIVKGILKQLNCKRWVFNKMHHEHHAITGFYFSKFSEALVLVSDGGGEIIKTSHKTIYPYQTMDSIHLVNNKIKSFYKAASNYRGGEADKREDYVFKIGETDVLLTSKIIGGLKYMEYRFKAGFSSNQEGQLMGLAAYKNKKCGLPRYILNYAHEAQEETLKDRIALIKKARQYSNCKNIVLSGGYHLNCLNNFKLVKHFPELNFFVDPIPYDGGTAVGVALHENYKK